METEQYNNEISAYQETQQPDTFYIIRAVGTKNCYLSDFSTDIASMTLKFELGYVGHSKRFSQLTEAQAIAKSMLSKRSGLTYSAYEILLGFATANMPDMTLAGAVIWSTED